MYLEKEQEEGYPATVKIVKEESSLVVHISLKTPWGTLASPDLCGFYDEFEKNAKQASIRTETKQPILSSKKLPDGGIESNLPSHLHPPLTASTRDPKNISASSLPRKRHMELRKPP